MTDDIQTAEADTPVGKFKITGASLNNLATFASLVLLCLVAVTLYAHAGDAKESAKAVAAELRDANREVANALKESNKEISQTLREMSRATREQNCLLSLPPEQRQKNAEVCRRISQ